MDFELYDRIEIHRRVGSSAAAVPIQLQSDAMVLTYIVATSRLQERSG